MLNFTVKIHDLLPRKALETPGSFTSLDEFAQCRARPSEPSFLLLEVRENCRPSVDPTIPRIVLMDIREGEVTEAKHVPCGKVLHQQVHYLVPPLSIHRSLDPRGFNRVHGPKGPDAADLLLS